MDASVRSGTVLRYVDVRARPESTRQRQLSHWYEVHGVDLFLVILDFASRRLRKRR
jgi:hypothetical protein